MVSVVGTILLVAFVIVCILLVLLVLAQNEDSNGMGSSFGGGQSAAFGAHSASVLTKTTGVLVALFFIIAFGIGLLNKPVKKAALNSVSAETAVTEEAAGTSWYNSEEAAAEGEVVEAEAAETVESEVAEEAAAE